MNVIAWLLLAWFSLTSALGGGSEPAGSPAPSATEPPASAAPYPAGTDVADTDSAIEQRFLTRSPLPTCGMREIGELDVSGDAPPEYDVDCLQQALDAGDGAESVVLLTTEDGGQVVVYYRLNPGGPMETLADRRGNRPAGRGWAYRVCEPPSDLATGPCRG